MELIKKNIHMDRVKYRAFSQIAIEDDVNIPDAKADVDALNFEKGKIQIEELKLNDNNVFVKGNLEYSILYQSKEEAEKLVVLEGKVPFEETIYMDGIKMSDAASIHTELEDLTVAMINSRKINIRALISLKPFVEELYDEDTTVDIYSEHELEYYKKKLEIVQIAIQKNDIFRMKEELEIPKNYPNVVQILWDSVTLGEVEFRVLDEKIHIQGDVNIFIMYEGEGEEHPIRTFESSIPISGSLECHGSKDIMIGDFEYEISQKVLDIRPDFDGEDRALGVDLILDIAMKLYEDESIDVITDIYGVNHEVVTETKTAEYRKLLMKNIGKLKVAERLKIKNVNAGILQLIHSDGMVTIDSQIIEKDSIVISGNVTLQVMYVTNDDKMPYRVTKGSVPFSYTMEVNGVKEEDHFKMIPSIEQLQVSMLDSEEMDVKAVICFKTIIFQTVSQEIITSMDIMEVDPKKLQELPGMVIYMVKAGDNLWNIGKKYYVSVDKIKEMNSLTVDEIMCGDKLFIARGN